MFKAKWKFAVATAIALAITPAVQAVTFNLIDTGGAAKGTLARQGFDLAAAYWSSVLSDKVTVNLEIGFDSLGDRILGQTGSSSDLILTSAAYSALRADRTSALDMTAVSHLQPLKGPDGAIDMVVNDYYDKAKEIGYTDTAQRLDTNQSGNNVALDVNTANLKALGIKTNAFGDALDPNAVDGSITFNSDLPFDFNPTNGIDKGSSDFIAVAIHEIGHALGFVSGVDTYDVFSEPNSPVIGTYQGIPITAAQALELGIYFQGGYQNLEDFAVGSILDLYRYNEKGQLDWSTSDGKKLFSLDGRTAVYGDGAFSLGAFNGDGNQASHWAQPADQSTRDAACSNFLGIMNPYACSGQGDAISGLDLAALDAIGWNITPAARDKSNYLFTTADVYRTLGGPVPEPATWAQFILGFGLIGGLVRRRRAALHA